MASKATYDDPADVSEALLMFATAAGALAVVVSTAFAAGRLFGRMLL